MPHEYHPVALRLLKTDYDSSGKAQMQTAPEKAMHRVRTKAKDVPFKYLPWQRV